MTSTTPRSTSASGRNLDELAALEEERRFLLGSLADLEREHAAGDVDDGDYETLKDGYTVRAAAVLREIDAGQARLAQRSPRRWGRIVAVTAGVLVVAVGIGFALAQAWGERNVGQQITGMTPGDETTTLLASAREALRTGDFATANQLFAQVVEEARDDGVEHPEAMAYFGWTLALLSRSEADEDAADLRLEASVVALRQAIDADPSYPDPYCFLAIVEYQFLGDAQAALPNVRECQSHDPPTDVAGLIDEFAAEIEAAARPAAD